MDEPLIGFSCGGPSAPANRRSTARCRPPTTIRSLRIWPSRNASTGSLGSATCELRTQPVQKVCQNFSAIGFIQHSVPAAVIENMGDVVEARLAVTPNAFRLLRVAARQDPGFREEIDRQIGANIRMVGQPEQSRCCTKKSGIARYCLNVLQIEVQRGIQLARFRRLLSGLNGAESTVRLPYFIGKFARQRTEPCYAGCDGARNRSA